ncbi:uncharacterized protein LOC144451494 [Glandiceps talaboti]
MSDRPSPMRTNSRLRSRSVYVIGCAIFVLLLVVCTVSSNYNLQPTDYDKDEIWLRSQSKKTASESVKIPTWGDFGNKDNINYKDVVAIKRSYLTFGDLRRVRRDVADSRDILSRTTTSASLLTMDPPRFAWDQTMEGLRDYWRSMLLRDQTTTEPISGSGSGSGGCENTDDEDCEEYISASGAEPESGSGDMETPEPTTTLRTVPLTTRVTKVPSSRPRTTKANLILESTTSSAPVQTGSQYPITQPHSTTIASSLPMSSSTNALEADTTEIDQITSLKPTTIATTKTTQPEDEEVSASTTARAVENTDSDLIGGRQPEKPKSWFSSWRAAVIIGIVTGLIALAFVTVFVARKIRNREKGAYTIDEGRNYVSSTPGHTIIMESMPNGKEEKDGVNNPTVQKKADPKELFV